MGKIKMYQITDTQKQARTINKTASITVQTLNIKRILLIVIAIFLGIVAFGSKDVKAATTTVNNVTYIYDVIDGKAENVMIDDDNSTLPTLPNLIVIPDTLDTYPVISLGDGTGAISKTAILKFDGAKVKYTFKLPSTVTTINENAFYRSNLVSNNFSQLRVIKDNAFEEAWIDPFICSGNDTNLLELTVNRELDLSGLESLGNRAFYQTGVNRATGGAHSWINSSYGTYTSIKFGSNLSKIGNEAFYNQNRLKSVTIPDTIAEIGEHAFERCSILTNLTISPRNTELNIGNEAFKSIGISSIDILNIYKLGSGVFSYCDNLTTATLEEGITKIEDSTFYQSSLTNLTVPSTLTNVGAGSLAHTRISNNVYESILEKNIDTIGSGAFAGTDLTGEIVVPNKVTTLGDGVFSGCIGITKATIEMNSITKLPNSTFENCTGLTSYVLPESIVEIGDSAFKGCTGLTGELTIPARFTSIGNSAFENCNNITKVTINGQLRSIGDYAFYNTATSQEVVRIDAPVTDLGTKIFTKPTEIFVGNNEANVTVADIWYGNGKPIIHFRDCKHAVEVVCMLPGVTVTHDSINLNNTTAEAVCESDYSFTVNIADEYQSKYENFLVRVTSEGQYSTSDAVVEYVTLDSNNSYTFENITRDKKVEILRIENGTNLVLRQFVSKINEKDVTNRIPSISKTSNKTVASFEYNHTKYPYSVETLDKITYTIRVYNEGNVAGKANEIMVKLPQKLSLVEGDSTNEFYGWQASEDGKTLKTTYLQNKEIAAYSGAGRPQYEDIKIVCEVGAPRASQEYLLTVAEITDGNDMDSLPDDYVESEEQTNNLLGLALASNTSIYVRGLEDDSDFEFLSLDTNVESGYNLVVKKIDSTSNELLDGAKIRLYDENMQKIKDIITENGEANFGNLTTYNQNEKDTYYIEEVETPVGYKRTINGIIRMDVVKVFDNNGKVTGVTVELDVDGKIYDNFDIEDEEDVGEEYIPIYTAEQLRKIGDLTAQEVEVNGQTYIFAPNKKYRLQQDIDYGGQIWTAIPQFYGTLDGNGHEIKNIVLSGTTTNKQIGLIGFCTGDIKNLNLKATTAALQDVQENPGAPYHGIGGLAAILAGGRVTNCNVDFTVTAQTWGVSENVGGIAGHTMTSSGKDPIIKDCKVKFTMKSGSVEQNVGSIVGVTLGNIKIVNCTNEGSSIGNDNSPKGTWIITGVGGMVGFCNYGTAYFKNCTNSMNVYASRENVGGFVGYSFAGVTFLNCTNNGDVCGSAFTRNMGGFVGCVDKYGIARFEKSVNNGNLITEESEQTVYPYEKYGGKNLGGLIGYTDGAVSIKDDCENYGNIGNLKTTNAGGMVGFANSQTGLPTNTMATFENDTITIYITNESTVDNYNINIKKIEKINGTTNAKLLDGAKFNVYKYNEETEEKELIYENQETVDGILTIANIPITSLTHDVFYLKETEAPEGYDILVKDLIKVEITPKWDGVNEKYIIDPELTLVQDLEDDEVEEISHTDNETLPSAPRNVNVTWKTNKVVIEDANNYGSVYAYNTAGGLVGGVNGNIFVKNSNNKLNETNDNKITLSTDGLYGAGGIVGESLGDKKNLLSISNCTNETEVSGKFHSGGIVGKTEINAEVSDCVNTGTIKARYHAGGIVGYLFGQQLGMTSTITGCANGIENDTEDKYGKVSVYDDTNGVSACTGGILGATSSDTTIEDCTNYAKIESYGQIGGILGCSLDRDLFINNTKSKGDVVRIGTNSCIGGVGGILGQQIARPGTIPSEQIGVDNVQCTITNSSFSGNITKNSQGCMGGIIGTIYSDPYSNSVYVGNCKVGGDGQDNIKTLYSVNPGSGDNDIGGLIGLLQGGEVVSIYDNEVKYLKISCGTEDIRCNSHIGGLLGNYYNYRSILSKMDINNNEVDNISIINISGSNCTSAGLAGLVSFDSRNNIAEVNAKNNNVTSSSIKIDSGNLSSAAGLIGITYGSKFDINLENCNVIDTDIINELSGLDSNTAGLVGYFQANKASVKRCEVKSTGTSKNKIEQNTYSAYEAPVGGLFSVVMAEEDVNIEDSKVTNMNIIAHAERQGEPVGGVIGYILNEGNVKVNNVEVSNVDFDVTGDTYEAVTGGYVGGHNGYSLEIANSKFINNTMEVQGTAVGGLVGCALKDTNISGIDMSEISINQTGEAGDFNRIFGGFVGVQIDNSLSISDSKIENLEYTVDRDCKGMGGMIGYCSEANLSDNILKDIKLNHNDLNIERIINRSKYNTPSIGGLIGTAADANISNNIIDEIEINAEDANVGGFIGDVSLYDREVLVTESQVKNALFKDKGTRQVAGVYGGLIGNVTTSVWKDDYKLEIKNSTVEGLEVDNGIGERRHVGGLIGYTSGDYTITDNHPVTVKDLKVNIGEIEDGNPRAGEGNYQGIIGGIVGVSLGTKTGNQRAANGTISNVKVQDMIANGHFAIGGIIGYGKADISNSTVKNIDTLLEGEDIVLPTRETVVGGIAGILVEGSKLSNVTVTADANTTHTLNSTLYAGGIAGVNNGSLTGGKVENIIVKTLKELEEARDDEGNPEGEIAEPATTESVIVDYTVPCANAVQARALEGYTNTVVTNVKVILGTVEKTVNE